MNSRTPCKATKRVIVHANIFRIIISFCNNYCYNIIVLLPADPIRGRFLSGVPTSYYDDAAAVYVNNDQLTNDFNREISQVFIGIIIF